MREKEKSLEMFWTLRGRNMFWIIAYSNCWTLFQQELYKKTEELEEKKADKRVVEREIVSGFIWFFILDELHRWIHTFILTTETAAHCFNGQLFWDMTQLQFKTFDSVKLTLDLFMFCAAETYLSTDVVKYQLSRTTAALRVHSAEYIIPIFEEDKLLYMYSNN